MRMMQGTDVRWSGWVGFLTKAWLMSRWGDRCTNKKKYKIQNTKYKILVNRWGDQQKEMCPTADRLLSSSLRIPQLHPLTSTKNVIKSQIVGSADGHPVEEEKKVWEAPFVSDCFNNV